MMDLSKFFSYFNTNPSIGYSEKDMESFKNSPLYKIKVFERLIINGVAFKKSLVNFFNNVELFFWIFCFEILCFYKVI